MIINIEAVKLLAEHNIGILEYRSSNVYGSGGEFPAYFDCGPSHQCYKLPGIDVENWVEMKTVSKIHLDLSPMIKRRAMIVADFSDVKVKNLKVYFKELTYEELIMKIREFKIDKLLNL